jgi:hypothetical protein
MAKKSNTNSKKNASKAVGKNKTNSMQTTDTTTQTSTNIDNSCADVTETMKENTTSKTSKPTMKNANCNDNADDNKENANNTTNFDTTDLPAQNQQDKNDKDSTSALEKSNIYNKNSSSPEKFPVKRKAPSINFLYGRKKKNSDNSKSGNKGPLRVEGYAFHDDIIGVAHVKPNGEDAFNLTIRNMILADDLKDNGFSAFVSLRDKTSGKNNSPLRGADGYVRYLFMCINVHEFGDAKSAASAVAEQCANLRDVR